MIFEKKDQKISLKMPNGEFYVWPYDVLLQVSEQQMSLCNKKSQAEQRIKALLDEMNRRISCLSNYESKQLEEEMIRQEYYKAIEAVANRNNVFLDFHSFEDK